jgi:hypothetical protein
MSNQSSQTLLRAATAMVAMLAFLAAPALAAQTLGSAFTYQGKLTQNGTPANGQFSMRFLLYDDPAGSNTVGAVILPAVAVADGLFTVDLDFGVSGFDGNERWLEVIVAGQPLSPRQRVAATPYSLQTRGLFVDDQKRVGIGTTTPQWPLDVRALQSVLRLESMLSSNGSVLELRGDSFLGNPPTLLGAINFNNSASSYPGQISYATSGEMRFRVEGQQPIKLTPNSLQAEGDGQFRENATVHAVNTQPTGGMAGYFQNNSTWATTHMENDGSGEILWLQRPGTGNYIVATNGSDWKFWVDNAGVTHTKVLEILGGSDLSERFDVGTGNVGWDTEKNQATRDARDDRRGAVGSHAAPAGMSEPVSGVAPGMVVSIDPDREGKLVVSRTTYDRRVAGVISGAGGVKPGMLMGQDGTAASGASPVALTGRVYCLATANNGPIEPGDLLTTSSLPGHAMRVDDHARAQGAVLGKAMGSLKHGEGLVLVLVGLQ